MPDSPGMCDPDLNIRLPCSLPPISNHNSNDDPLDPCYYYNGLCDPHPISKHNFNYIYTNDAA
jgi:hypothetical protein